MYLHLAVFLQPGDYLEVVLDTRARPELANNEKGEPHDVLLLIAHLKSYQHMGKVRVECVSGCDCDSDIIDGHTDQRSSQMHFHRVVAGQAEECKLRLTGESYEIYETDR